MLQFGFVGFNEAKQLAIELLQAGSWLPETRLDQSEKNLLFTGDVSVEEAVAIVEATKGPGQCTKHHANPAIDVWTFRSVYLKTKWYVKFYFTKSGTMCMVIYCHK